MMVADCIPSGTFLEKVAFALEHCTPINIFEEQNKAIENLTASNKRLVSENLALIKETHDLREAIALRDSFADGIE